VSPAVGVWFSAVSRRSPMQNCATKEDKTMDKIDETIFWLLLFIVIGAFLTIGAYLTEGDYE
jgi:prolipoprotein diacylglyceryltransferase